MTSTIIFGAVSAYKSQYGRYKSKAEEMPVGPGSAGKGPEFSGAILPAAQPHFAGVLELIGMRPKVSTDALGRPPGGGSTTPSFHTVA